MQFFRKQKIPSQDDVIELLEILHRCNTRIQASEDSIWSCMDVHKIRVALSHAIDALNNENAIRPKEISFLFLPTGPLQDTAIDNGWGDEFLTLAKRFDETIKHWDEG